MDLSKRAVARVGMGGHSLPSTGVTDVWLTPPHILEALGPFDLDPCAAPEPRPWPTAAEHITVPHDGLASEWAGRVWLNPPYGQSTDRWMQRLAHYGTGTALIFARTETECWHEHIWPKATAILFLRQRLHFHRPDGTRSKHNSGAPSALIAYGPIDAYFLFRSGLPGHFVNPQHQSV